jgi:hypothetical protein
MKIDAETLIKQRFWLVAALCPFLVIIAYLVDITSVAGVIRTKKKFIEDKVKEIKNAGQGTKRPNDVDLKKKEAEQHKALEEVVWKDAYAKFQADISTWPEEIEQKYDFKKGKTILQIQAVRGGTAAVPDQNGLAENQFRGLLMRIGPTYVDVKGRLGKDGKGKIVQLPFHLGPEMKISLRDASGKEQSVSFPKLQAYKPKDDSGTVVVPDTVTITYQLGKYFGDWLTREQQDTFKESYNSQLLDILKIVEPVEGRGKGVVQLRDWEFVNDVEQLPAGATFLNFVSNWQGHRFLPEEAWTAQEDLWIQRELYRRIKQANDMVGRFHGDGGDGKEKEFAFTNPYWELRLRLTADNKLGIKIKNLLPRRQKAEQTFLVKVRPDKVGPDGQFQPDGAPVKVAFSELLNPKEKTESGLFNPEQEKEMAPYSLPAGATPTGIYGVEQVLTPQTAAVRRIDYIMVGGSNQGNASPGSSGLKGPGFNRPPDKGKLLQGGLPMAGGQPIAGGQQSKTQSHRNFVQELVAFAFPVPKDLKEETPKAPDAGKGMPPDKAPPMKGPMPDKGSVGKGRTTNGIELKRYTEITPQARRIPVCLALIVDQDHVGLVHAAFADSGLRFLTTQVILNRYPHSLRASEGAIVAFNPKAPPVLPKELAMSGRLKGMMMPKMPGAFEFPGGFVPGSGKFPGVGGPPAQRTTTSSGEEVETNVELVLYGIVTLYERFPPRKSP